VTRTSAYLSVTVLLLAATLTASKLSESQKPETLARPLENIAGRLGPWTVSDEPPLQDSVVQVLKPTSYLSRTYRRADRRLALFIAYYGAQQAGESMHSPKNCLPGSGWEVHDSGTVGVPLNAGSVTVNRYVVQKNGERLLVLYWYQSPRRIVASEYLGKIWLLRDRVLSGRTAGSIVRLVLPDRPGGLEEGVSFASLIIPEMQLCLGD
jgi:EpsI family protein